MISCILVKAIFSDPNTDQKMILTDLETPLKVSLAKDSHSSVLFLISFKLDCLVVKLCSLLLVKEF